MKSTRSSQKGRVFVGDIFAGIIEESEGFVIFTYDKLYLKRDDSTPVSVTLPLREEPFKQKTMIPFFDGLIPEGWLLNIITHNWKINPRDRMSLLLFACKDCIGNISIAMDK